MARKVTDPGGVRWKVGRQWSPWRVRVRREQPDWLQDGPGEMDWMPIDSPGAVLVALGVLAAVALAFLVVWPIVVLAVEIVLVVLAVLVTAAGRLALRRPWTVRAEARGIQDHHHSWSVVGWRASGELVDAVAQALAAGRELPPGAATVGASPPPLPCVGERSGAPR